MSNLLVIGSGPGIGTAVARRFGREGMSVGLIARTKSTTDHAQAIVGTAGAKGVATAQADASDENALKAALDKLIAQLGVPDVVVYNAFTVNLDTIFDLGHAQRQASYAVNVLGAVTTMAHVAPKMVQAGAGTILVTCGMPKPDPRLISLSIDKAGLRAAVAAVAEQYRAQNIHVASVTIGGVVAPHTRYDPDAIAEQYWRLYADAPLPWQANVDYQGNTTLPEITIEAVLKRAAGD